MKELKTAFPEKTAFLERGEDLKGDNILKSNSAIIENPVTNFLARKLPEVSKMVINTSIMDDPQPKGSINRPFTYYQRFASCL